MGEKTECDLRVVENVLDGEAESNDRGFPMLARPQVDVAVRSRLDFPASLEQPWMLKVDASQGIAQQKVQVSQAQVL